MGQLPANIGKRAEHSLDEAVADRLNSVVADVR
jgi:hypothetical protein